MHKPLLLAFLTIYSCISSAELLILNYSTEEKPNEKALHTIKGLQEKALENGITIQTKGVPWKRALKMLEVGQADGLINVSYKENRAEYAQYPMKNGQPDFSKRLNDGNTYYLYKNIDSTLTWDGEKFAHVDGPVGAQDTFAVIEDLNKFENIDLVTKVTSEQLVADLYRGKIAAYASIPFNIEQVLENNANLKERIVKLPIPIRKQPYYLVYSKKRYDDKKQEMDNLWEVLKQSND